MLVLAWSPRRAFARSGRSSKTLQVGAASGLEVSARLAVGMAGCFWRASLVLVHAALPGVAARKGKAASLLRREHDQIRHSVLSVRRVHLSRRGWRRGACLAHRWR